VVLRVGANLRGPLGSVECSVSEGVHQMPKFAMARYMYFAGFVKENVGVTSYQM